MRELLAVLLVALGTYALRASMIARVGAAPLPDLVRRGLRHLSPAVLAALVLPALVIGPEGAAALRAAPLAAAVVATVVAHRTRSIPLVLVAGLVTHELTRWLL